MRSLKSYVNSEPLPSGIEIRRSRGQHHLFLNPTKKPTDLNDFIAVVDRRRKVARIVVLEVQPHRRSTGVGTNWVRWFEHYAEAAGALLVTGKVFPGTEGFWRLLGYELEEPKIAGNMMLMKRILSKQLTLV